MGTIKVRGHEFEFNKVKDSHNRRALKFKNNIINTLRKLGLTEDDVDIVLENIAIKKSPASATWYLDGHRLYYSYGLAQSYVDNLFVVSKVIEFEVSDILNKRETIQDFIHHFSEDEDVNNNREKARAILGVSKDCMDINVINDKYKILAKKYHPDMLDGSIEKFKKINNAHKLLKKELV